MKRLTNAVAGEDIDNNNIKAIKQKILRRLL